MEYQEQLAGEIIRKANLSTATRHTWRHRGRIPDRYLSKDFIKRKPLTRHDEYIKHQVSALLENPKIYNANLARHLDIPAGRLADLPRGKARLDREELKAIKNLIKKINLYVRKAVGRLNEIQQKDELMRSTEADVLIADLITYPFLHPSVVLKASHVRYADAYAFVKRIKEGVSSGGSPLDEDRKKRIIEAYAITAFEINI